MRLYSILYKVSILSIFTLFSCSSGIENNENTYKADLIIYGGTASAVIAAVQGRKMGKSVIVVSPDVHLGGLTSGGLGWTDSGKREVIGGLSRSFYKSIFLAYNKPETWDWQKREEYTHQRGIDDNGGYMWVFEPSVAENIFDRYIDEFDIQLHRDEWLDRESGVSLEDNRIKSIRTLSGKQFEGKMFIDATYEGDLMATSGVSYHVGREGLDVYNEEWNGIQTGVLHHKHWFDKDIDPYKVPGDPGSGLLPRISPEHPGKKGNGDNKIQAYCFRMCLTDHPDNRVPFERPEGYDSTQYELLVRIYDGGWQDTFKKFDPIPNRKTDTNNHGPFSTDNIGMNYDYPEASYERRKEIIKEHEQYQKGWLYFIANDPRIPKDQQEEMQRWGLAKDEFVDNGNWPHQLYIREARRMIGEKVITENEVMGKEDVTQPVGMGSYAMDSHNVQRYIKEDGFVQNEGDIGVKVPKPYQIPFGSLVPKKEECENLVVPVCLSSSHIAFGSIRMEPVFMVLGQSAATIAVQAIEKDQSVQDISYDELRAQLLKDNQVLEY